MYIYLNLNKRFYTQRLPVGFTSMLGDHKYTIHKKKRPDLKTYDHDRTRDGKRNSQCCEPVNAASIFFYTSF